MLNKSVFLKSAMIENSILKGCYICKIYSTERPSNQEIGRYLTARDETGKLYTWSVTSPSAVSSVTFEVTMCKVMTRVITLSTSARYGHDSSHYPRKNFMIHNNKLDIDDKHVELTCRHIHSNMIVKKMLSNVNVDRLEHNLKR